MSNKIECKWGRDSEFSKKVIEHFILQEHPEYCDCIEEKVEKWFAAFEGSEYEGDCITGRKFKYWFRTYFEDLGFNKEHLAEYVKKIGQCFLNLDDKFYEDFMNAQFPSNFSMKLKEISPEQDIRYVYEILSIIKESDFRKTCDFKKAAQILLEFDKEFNWITEYDFDFSIFLEKFFFFVDFVFYHRETDENEEKAEFWKIANLIKGKVFGNSKSYYM